MLYAGNQLMKGINMYGFNKGKQQFISSLTTIRAINNDNMQLCYKK